MKARDDRGNQVELTAVWRDGELILQRGEQRWQAPMVTHGNGEQDRFETLREVGRQLSGASLTPLVCGSCARFQMSGMSSQMSGGSIGYCLRVGFRDRHGLVDIEHGCGEHLPLAGWFDGTCSLEAVGERQLAARREGRRAAFEGAMVGLAVGDALGFPCEFRSRAAILEAFGPDGVTELVRVHDPRWPARPMIVGADHPAGTYSDDTQMSIAVAQGLLDAPGDSLDELMRAMADRFVAWSCAPDNDRAPGSTCLSGCEALARGVSWRVAGVPDSKGAGAPMRVVPIGLRFWREPERVLEVARASSLLTHGHPTAVEASAAAALLVALALAKKSPQAMYDAVVAACGARSLELLASLEKVPSLLDAEPAVALSARGLGEGWVAEEAVAGALWCFWRSPDDLRRTVVTAANSDGDSDTLACIAGGISGAFNGISAIPDSWAEPLENYHLLVELGGELEALTRSPGP